MENMTMKQAFKLGLAFSLGVLACKAVESAAGIVIVLIMRGLMG